VTHLCKKCGSVIPLRRDLKPGEVVAGFKIEEELGRGAMGIVYQARQTNLDREVAIKILSDDSASDEVYVERFFREARAAASLSHPNVVQAYDAGVTDDGIYYFVMEKVTGENLDLVLNNVGPLNIPQALDVFLAVANALAYAWNRNQLSHGDIKPENIIMRLNGKVKLADFGLARRAKDPELADEDIRATPAYAPPEIIRDDKSVPGFKSDMYSFGATAYHILIGHEPFIDTDPMKVCSMQLTEVQTPLSELNPNIPRRLSDLVDALMEKDPEDRPATWNDVIDELKAIRQDLDAASAAAAGQNKKKKSRSKRNPASRKPSAKTAVVAVVAALAVIAAIVAAVALRHGGTRKDPDAPVLPGKPSVSGDPASNSNIASKPAGAPARDEAFYRARWRMLLDEAGKNGPELKQVEQFVSDAGAMAPDEAVKMLAAMKAARDAETAQSNALILRNGLMDEAEAFDAEKLGKLDFDQLDAMILSVQTRLAELKKLNATLAEPILQPDQQKKVEEYLKKLTDLQLSSSLGGTVSSGTAARQGTSSKTDVSEPKKTEPEKTNPGKTEKDDDEPGKDSKLLLNYLLLLDSLPDTVNDESDRAGAMRLLNELLADKDFTDDVPRKNCIGIRKFLVLSQQSLLPYLAENENVLRGMKLFPNSYPDSVLDDITGSTIRMKVPNEKASIFQNVTWSKLRSEEGEDRLVVTLINSPQLAKYAEDFREYLFIRAIFLGVDPDMLKKRYDRTSGLSQAKRDELYRTASFFRASELED
jgi:serine/threonine protein kinase